MNFKFENRIIFTKDVFSEYAKGVIQKKTEHIAFPLAAFFLLVSIIEFYNMDFDSSAFLFPFGVALLFYPVILARVPVKKAYEQQKLLNGGKELEKMTRFSDRIDMVSSNKAEHNFAYSQVTQICETKNLLILKINRKVNLLLDKDGFTVGNLENFRYFIRESCPGVKYKFRLKIDRERSAFPPESTKLSEDRKIDVPAVPSPQIGLETGKDTTLPAGEGKNPPEPPMQAYAAGSEYRAPFASVAVAKPHPVVYVIMILLFVLSFLSLFFGLALVSSSNSFSASPTENNWKFLLFLPLPLASLILGIFYKHKGMKTTKNIVAGIIFTILLCVFGSFSLLDQNGTISHSMSYLDTVALEIHFDLPSKGKVTTQNYSAYSGSVESGSQASSKTDDTDYISLSNIEFTDSKQISDFETSLHSSSLWVSTIPTPLSAVIPELYSAQTDKALGFDSFMVYNVSLGVYNKLPEQSGTYRFLYLAYSSSGKKMVIGEYLYHVILK